MAMSWMRCRHPGAGAQKTNVKEEGTVAGPTKRVGVPRKDGSVDVTAQLEGLGFTLGRTVKPKKEHATELGTGIFKIESITQKGRYDR